MWADVLAGLWPEGAVHFWTHQVRSNWMSMEMIQCRFVLSSNTYECGLSCIRDNGKEEAARALLVVQGRAKSKAV